MPENQWSHICAAHSGVIAEETEPNVGRKPSSQLSGDVQVPCATKGSSGMMLPVRGEGNKRQQRTILDQLHTHALADGGVRLLCLDTAANETQIQTRAHP